MTKSHYSFLAMLPVLALLSTSPAQIIESSPNRGLATITTKIQIKYPKYEALAAQIDRRALLPDPNIDLSKFSSQGDKLRSELMKERSKYKVDSVDPILVVEQNKRLDSLVNSLVRLEESFAKLKEKNSFVQGGDEVAQATINELKVTLESLLIDKAENDFIIRADEILTKEKTPVAPEGSVTNLDVKKEELKEEIKVEVTEVIKEEAEEEEPEHNCLALEEQNKVLTTPVETLMAEQKTIMDKVYDMFKLVMASQYNPFLPYLTGPVVQNHTTFPMGNLAQDGQWVYVPHGGQVQEQIPSYQPTYLGRETIEEAAFPAPQNFQAQNFYPLPQYQPNIFVGEFGPQNQMFNFGESLFNPMNFNLI